MDDQMRALVCLKSALILYFEKTKLAQKGACIHKNLKNFRLLAIAAFFWKSIMEKLALRLKIPVCKFFAAKILL